MKTLAIKERKNCKDWYVLHYNTKTTEYLNEIVFKTLEEAKKEFNEATFLCDEDRIELIFSPEENDKEYYDNIIIDCKEFLK